MNVICEFDGTADIVNCPNHVVENIESYQESFWKWLYDKSINHSYWTFKNGEKYCCCYRSEAFVDWLNQIVLCNSSEKATILQQYLETWDLELPTIHF